MAGWASWRAWAWRPCAGRGSRVRGQKECPDMSPGTDKRRDRSGLYSSARPLCAWPCVGTHRHLSLLPPNTIIGVRPSLARPSRLQTYSSMRPSSSVQRTYRRVYACLGPSRPNVSIRTPCTGRNPQGRSLSSLETLLSSWSEFHTDTVHARAIIPGSKLKSLEPRSIDLQW